MIPSGIGRARPEKRAAPVQKAVARVALSRVPGGGGFRGWAKERSRAAETAPESSQPAKLLSGTP